MLVVMGGTRAFRGRVAGRSQPGTFPGWRERQRGSGGKTSYIKLFQGSKSPWLVAVAGGSFLVTVSYPERGVASWCGGDDDTTDNERAGPCYSRSAAFSRLLPCPPSTCAVTTVSR